MNRRELLNQITVFIDEINSKDIDKESHDHYLKNHLINLANALSQDADANVLLRAAKTFTMFCTDSMDWDTPEYKNIIQIGIQASRIAKSELNN